MRIAIIGAGVAGALLLDGLRNTETVDAVCFEQVSAGDGAQEGTGLNIGPNAAKALLRQAPEVRDTLRAVSLPWRRWAIELTDGTRLVDLDLLTLAEQPGFRIRWSELYRLLRTRVAPGISFGLRLAAIEEDGKGRLVPVFHGAEQSLHRFGAFDMLIGADGRYSRLRETTLGAPEAHFPGIGTWRLLVPGPAAGPINEYGQYFNGHARLLSFRLPGDDVYIAGSFPLAGDGPIPAEVKTVEAQRHFLVPQRLPSSPQARWMLDAMAGRFKHIHWARTQEIEPAYHALDGRVLFLGDASHAMVQTLGQGATQAIEDALVAGDSVQRHAPDPKAIATDYESRRSARVEFVRQFSLDASDTMLPGSDPVEGARDKARAPFLARLRRLYNEPC